jgi:hypothetical protein
VPLSSARWDLAAAHPNGLIYAVGGIGDCLVDVACPTHPTATSTPTNISMATSVPAPTNTLTATPSSTPSAFAALSGKGLDVPKRIATVGAPRVKP